MTMENLNLSHLTPAERERILAVLKRNDSLERKDQERVKKIQTEVKQLKLKGVIKEGINADKTCARCRSELGIFFNRGALCPQCHAKVCPQCRQNSEKAEEGWLCSLCYKQLELEIQSGKWFYKKLHEKNNRNKVLKGSELVKVSIRRPQNGNATGRSTAANDVKQSLSNNNASPKPHHHSPASVHGSAAPIGGDRDHVDGLHGDKGHGGSIHQVGFPRDSDRRRLMDLLKPHSDLSSTEGGESPSVNRRKQVKQVHSGRYKDSDSDSLSSGPSSPQISSSRTHTGSVQSSVLSSDRAVHSDMNSEIDSIHSSPRLLSGQTGLPMVTTNYRSNNVLSHSPSSRSGRLVESSTASTLEDTTPSRDGHPERSRVSSSSSESEEEFVVEELSRIKFRKCSTKRSINGSYGITSSPSLEGDSVEAPLKHEASPDDIAGQGSESLPIPGRQQSHDGGTNLILSSHNNSDLHVDFVPFRDWVVIGKQVSDESVESQSENQPKSHGEGVNENHNSTNGERVNLLNGDSSGITDGVVEIEHLTSNSEVSAAGALLHSVDNTEHLIHGSTNAEKTPTAINYTASNTSVHDQEKLNGSGIGKASRFYNNKTSATNVGDSRNVEYIDREKMTYDEFLYPEASSSPVLLRKKFINKTATDQPDTSAVTRKETVSYQEIQAFAEEMSDDLIITGIATAVVLRHPEIYSASLQAEDEDEPDGVSFTDLSPDVASIAHTGVVPRVHDLEWDEEYGSYHGTENKTLNEFDDNAIEADYLNYLRVALSNRMESEQVDRRGASPFSTSPEDAKSPIYLNPSGDIDSKFDLEEEEFKGHVREHIPIRVRHTQHAYIPDDACSDTLSVITEVTEPATGYWSDENLLSDNLISQDDGLSTTSSIDDVLSISSSEAEVSSIRVVSPVAVSRDIGEWVDIDVLDPSMDASQFSGTESAVSGGADLMVVSLHTSEISDKFTDNHTVSVDPHEGFSASNVEHLLSPAKKQFVFKPVVAKSGRSETVGETKSRTEQSLEYKAEETILYTETVVKKVNVKKIETEALDRTEQSFMPIDTKRKVVHPVEMISFEPLVLETDEVGLEIRSTERTELSIVPDEIKQRVLNTDKVPSLEPVVSESENDIKMKTPSIDRTEQRYQPSETKRKVLNADHLQRLRASLLEVADVSNKETSSAPTSPAVPRKMQSNPRLSRFVYRKSPLSDKEINFSAVFEKNKSYDTDEEFDLLLENNRNVFDIEHGDTGHEVFSLKPISQVKRSRSDCEAKRSYECDGAVEVRKEELQSDKSRGESIDLNQSANEMKPERLPITSTPKQHKNQSSKKISSGTSDILVSKQNSENKIPPKDVSEPIVLESSVESEAHTDITPVVVVSMMKLEDSHQSPELEKINARKDLKVHSGHDLSYESPTEGPAKMSSAKNIDQQSPSQNTAKLTSAEDVTKLTFPENARNLSSHEISVELLPAEITAPHSSVQIENTAQLSSTESTAKLTAAENTIELLPASNIAKLSSDDDRDKNSSAKDTGKVKFAENNANLLSAEKMGKISCAEDKAKFIPTENGTYKVTSAENSTKFSTAEDTTISSHEVPTKSIPKNVINSTVTTETELKQVKTKHSEQIASEEQKVLNETMNANISHHKDCDMRSVVQTEQHVTSQNIELEKSGKENVNVEQRMQLESAKTNPSSTSKVELSALPVHTGEIQVLDAAISVNAVESSFEEDTSSLNSDTPASSVQSFHVENKLNSDTPASSVQSFHVENKLNSDTPASSVQSVHVENKILNQVRRTPSNVSESSQESVDFSHIPSEIQDVIHRYMIQTNPVVDENAQAAEAKMAETTPGEEHVIHASSGVYEADKHLPSSNDQVSHVASPDELVSDKVEHISNIQSEKRLEISPVEHNVTAEATSNGDISDMHSLERRLEEQMVLTVDMSGASCSVSDENSSVPLTSSSSTSSALSASSVTVEAARKRDLTLGNMSMSTDVTNPTLTEGKSVAFTQENYTSPTAQTAFTSESKLTMPDSTDSVDGEITAPLRTRKKLTKNPPINSNTNHNNEHPNQSVPALSSTQSLQQHPQNPQLPPPSTDMQPALTDNRSPSPSPSSRSRKGHEQDTAVKPADSEVIMAAYEGDIMYGVKTSSAEEPVKPALPQEPVPVISVTQEYVDDTESHRSSPRSMRSTGLKEASDAQSQSSHIPSPIKSDQSSLNPDDSTEDPDFDELFRSHTSSQHSSTVNDSPRSSNLLTPLSDSHESISSVYSDAGEGHFGKVDVTGEIQFALEYNYKSSVLEIRIKQCKDLAAVDKKRNRSDPYVKTYLLPDKTKSGKRKTRVKKHTLNPTFEETLKYNITKSELETRSLWISVWHGDRLGRNAFLGEVNLPMDYHNFDNISPSWHTLQDRKPQGISLLTYKGDLVLSIKYVPAESVPNRKKNRVSSRGELLVLVKEARNLTAVRANGFSDPFCKCYLLPDRTKGGKQKTGVMKKNCNPRWNHCFLFENVTVIDLKERCLELTIWDYDRLTSNDFLGGLRLSLGTGRSRGREVDWMDARGEEISLWQSMLDRPNVWIEGNLMLRPNMDKRVSSA